MQLKIHNLRFSYPQQQFTVKADHLDLQPGLTAMIGENGAGKSTLFKLLGGLVTTHQGKITVDQQPLKDFLKTERARKIGLAFQDPDDQFFNSSVKKEVEWELRQLKVPAKKRSETVTAVLKETNLSQQAQQNPYDLSLSDRKLLSIATVLAPNPQIALFDEPMIALDWPSQQLVSHIFTKLAKRGHTILVISHNLDWVAQNVPQVIVMGRGKVIFAGKTRDFLHQPTLVKKSDLLLPKVTRLTMALGINPPQYRL